MNEAGSISNENKSESLVILHLYRLSIILTMTKIYRIQQGVLL